MKKIFIFVIIIFILGFILPPTLLPPSKLGKELSGSFQRAMEPFGNFLLTARIFQDKNGQYQNRCVIESERVLMQSYTWRFIPGPVIEACVSPEQAMHTIGMIKKGAYDPGIGEWRNRIKSPLKIEEVMELSKLKFGPTATRINEAVEEAINNGIIPNEHDAAIIYLEKIKDEYLKKAEAWERA